MIKSHFGLFDASNLYNRLIAISQILKSANIVWTLIVKTNKQVMIHIKARRRGIIDSNSKDNYYSLWFIV